MDFKEIVNKILENRKNSNLVLDLFKILEGEINDELRRCVQALDDLFSHLFQRGDFVTDKNLEITNPKQFALEEQYIKWLLDLYEKFFNHLLANTSKGDSELCTLSITCMFNLMIADTRRATATNNFPSEKLQKILLHIISSDDKLLPEVKHYFSYLDILFYSWKYLNEFLLKVNDDSDRLTAKLISLLEEIKLTKDLSSLETLCFKDVASFKPYKEEILRKNVQKVWMKIINRRLNEANHRKLLVVLIESYLSQLAKPTLLTDFLVGSLSMGGATGLLALQGMSTLVTKHNLECPDIFGKLYNMFEADIFYTKFKPRLFYLADLFLRSTHIPEKLVAAFAKRLSRLSLSAKAPDLVLIMQFVGNLLVRHPALSVMIHSSDTDPLDNDPFVMEEKDPLKSRALESSLWELVLLKNHVQPKVAAAAKFLDNNLPSVEWDIRDELESSYSTMFESEMKKHSKAEPAMTFIRPVTAAQLSEDRLYNLWSLT